MHSWTRRQSPPIATLRPLLTRACVLSTLPAQFRALIASPASSQLPVAARALCGAVLGVLTKHGSIHGYYHSVMLPLILIEMEGGGFALLGAFDACCLCCVCAGVCAAVAARASRANMATDRQNSEAVACRRAVRINLLLGDYVCVPAWMHRSTPGAHAAHSHCAHAQCPRLPPRGSARLSPQSASSLLVCP